MATLSSVIRMPTRFDYSSNAEFNHAIANVLETSADITLDCIELEYIDSAGIGLLVMSHKKAQAKNIKMIMINIKPTPKEILYLANLQKIIDIK